MSRYICVANTGDILYTATPARDGAYSDGQVLDDGSVMLEVRGPESDAELLECFYFDHAGRTLCRRSARPTVFHTWDAVQKAWVGNVAHARRHASEAVNKHRDALLAKPIKFDGTLFDADDRATSNITNKILELANAVNTQNATWRDATNAMHSFNSADVFLSWLRLLLAAISARNTAMYEASWAIKADIDRLGTVDDILRVDVLDPARWPTV